jgi:Xaa-Pro aminopeptidase
VAEAQQAAREAVRPGIAAQDVDSAARRVLGRAGLGKFFTHSTGHGLGLEVHEDPRLAKGQKRRLEPGHVITIEPGIYVEGIGGIRIEDDVVVMPRGSEVLTTASREFLEL